MAIQTKTDSSGREFHEVWAGTPGSPTLALTITHEGIVLPAGDAVAIPSVTGTSSTLTGTAQAADVIGTTSVQTPLAIAGNADAATERTGGIVRAPNVVGATTNVAGADIKVAGGIGHGNGTPGKVLLQAAPAAAGGDNPQTAATVVTIESGAVTLAASASLTMTGALSTATAVATTSAQTPIVIAGNTDAALTARTGGTARAPDVATGGAGNVAGADITVRPGKGTGTGTPGKVLLQAAPVAAAGDNPQVPATVLTVESGAVTLADATDIAIGATTGTKIGGATSKIGFFNTTPAAKPTGVAVDAAGIHAALVTLGLIAGP